MRKSKEPKESQEELEKKNMERRLRELMEESFIPYPPSHILYNVGDRVQHGQVAKSIVKEVIDNGRIYLLDQICTDTNYGNPRNYERQFYASWLDICPWRSKEDLMKMDSFSEKDTMHLSFSQRSISSIFSMLYNFGIEMNPDYQRGDVWDLEDKYKLIDSVYKNIDIGKFVFISLPYKYHSPAYEVLDGKQRVIALSEFYECRYKFRGKYFSELSLRDQSHFEDLCISVAIVKDENVKPSDKYKYFLRLNTSGKPQDPKHIKEVEELYAAAISERK